MVASFSRVHRLALSGIDHATWYDSAEQEIACVADSLGVDSGYLTDLLAVFSPRVSVLRSVRRSFLWSQHKEHFDNTPKGIRRSIDHYEATGQLSTSLNGAPKVKAFAAALQGDSDAIVLDVWLSYALKVDQLEFRKRAVRAECERIICRVARNLSIPPRDCQAAVWAGVIQDAGRTVPTLCLMDELERFELFGFDYPRSGAIAIGVLS